MANKRMSFATVSCLFHQAQTQYWAGSWIKKGRGMAVRGLFSLLTTYGTRTTLDGIEGIFFMRRIDLVQV
ncbi:hypothetical protein F1985_05845 [Akkermansia sp. BIOML-A41]|jgi:hypothetical protein|uniref:hypothetical protein n=1 Tax=unclassified Akkermansia TaxID=2608915 RepID=UPI00122ED168|nr:MULTISPECIES: hypothetical protein [unclassified Akkermansia]KAA3210852.1 hypothetical protein F1997_03970 [Akkermansia sp. BIOML-A44]KAA3212829.1 hypothetical protein F1983_04295 [Akkermansia sp. BIOML-A42]KAA3223915.1 hypothetical protein F1985_05845 [Akkermansia sp. BIOML-A41]KAA3249889.1 hypothetical protein F1981_04820 [Akkermansia sp. BIOML-A27]KAA3268680.1 hypothetical protein F1943_02935 [Akkermansia sp. BIOML-A21]KAA3271404.1 hypothetical protein F1951_05395 [Akkermansia sp. BIOML